MIGALSQIELEILYCLQELHRPFWDQLMVFASFLGNSGWFFIVTGAVMLCFPETRRTGLAVLLSLAVGFLLGNLFIKNLVMRDRPCWIDPGIMLLTRSPGDYSFPSGHTLAAFETAVSVFLYHRRWGGVFLALAVLIGFSRLYLFVHFPTDVLAGAVLGSLIAWGVHIVLEKQKKCGII